MGIEQLSKEELVKLLADKQETLSLLSEKQERQLAIYMTPDFIRALSNARCRLCVGRTYEEMRPVPGDPEGKMQKTILHRGTPYTIEHGGDKLACRTCVHVRQALVDVGVQGIFV